ncbi:Uncharacterised protein [uncultured archaeon]|nr:Uncharacterised protein [uncultured archaeon]
MSEESEKTREIVRQELEREKMRDFIQETVNKRFAEDKEFQDKIRESSGTKPKQAGSKGFTIGRVVGKNWEA